MMAGGCGVVLGISDFEDAPADATTGVGGMGGAGTGGGEGGAGGDGGALACEPGSKMSCYEGPAGTEGRGACVPGEKTCLSDGSGFGECVGDVQPQPMDDCTNNVDANCDTMLTCSCTPGAMLTCYDGPNGTENNPPCQRGERTCNPMGTGYGPCDGQVVPEPVDECGTPVDENCNGVVDELCTCMPDQTQPCYGGPPGTQGVGVCQAGTATCNMTGTAWGPCVGEVQPGIADCSALGNESCSPMPCGEGLWSRIFTTAQKEDYDIPKSIDIDDNGNVFTAGTLVDTGQPLDIGGLLVNAAFVAKQQYRRDAVGEAMARERAHHSSHVGLRQLVRGRWFLGEHRHRWAGAHERRQLGRLRCLVGRRRRQAVGVPCGRRERGES